MATSNVITCSDEGVSLLDAASGKQAWRYPISATTSALVVKGKKPIDDHLYAGTGDGWIYKLSLATSFELKKFQVGGIVWGLAYADNVIYVNAGNTLQAHHAVTGHLWTHTMGHYSW